MTTSDGKTVKLSSEVFVFRLRATGSLRAVSWENRLTGRTLRLGNGPELDIDLDGAERRLWILGWRGMESEEGKFTPQADPGYRRGFHLPEFDDGKWPSHLNPTLFWDAVGLRYYWTRTHVFLPADCAGKPLRLVLGNLGLFDFRSMRVFINGHLAGTRRARDRWHEPGVFELGPRSRAHRFLRFGQDNVVALQLAEPVRRTARLDELDPKGARQLPFRDHYSAPFEQYLVVGSPLQTGRLRIVDWRVKREGQEEEVVFVLADDKANLAAEVTYRWQATGRCLHKQVVIRNASERAVRLMNVRLGSYRTDARVSEGERGFPVYLDDERFIGLTHPAGWVMGQKGSVALRQYPGRLLGPGEAFDCMESVLGVAPAGEARPSFLEYLRSRMRRVRRDHDRPYAIFEPFGSWLTPKGADGPDFFPTEKVILDNLRKVNRGSREHACHFDYYCLEFWADPRGDLQRPHVGNFPHGFGPVMHAIRRGGMKPGLWLDNWSLCDNPAVSPSRAGDPAYHSNPDKTWPAHITHFLCLASEPARTIHETALVHHLRENDVRLFKFDSMRAVCYNPAHEHLPGLYSVEAIYSSMIRLFHRLDTECPDVFLMLYWGYRSPWWLLHADTMFEAGLAIEAASPAQAPTLFARDGVTQGLDQAQWFCHDVPRLGRDPLGVWLSDWWWNSCIGKERWQEGFVMDLCRGHLLAQPWSDHAWLTGPERRQMGEFLALLRARPDCFGKPRFVLGNPWKNEPYGYCCTNGQRAFLALHNCSWRDAVIPLQLNSAWGLSDGGAWDIYRWFPNAKRLTGAAGELALRPFEVVLLEVVPAGEAPTLNRKFAGKAIRSGFAEPTVTLPLGVTPVRQPKPPSGLSGDSESAEKVYLHKWADSRLAGRKYAFALSGNVPASGRGGTLVITAERSKKGLVVQGSHPDREWGLQGKIGGRKIRPVPALKGDTYPAAWQTWRIPCGRAVKPRSFKLHLTALGPGAVKIACRGYFIPTGK